MNLISSIGSDKRLSDVSFRVQQKFSFTWTSECLSLQQKHQSHQTHEQQSSVLMHCKLACHKQQKVLNHQDLFSVEGNETISQTAEAAFLPAQSSAPPDSMPNTESQWWQQEMINYWKILKAAIKKNPSSCLRCVVFYLQHVPEVV